MMDVKKSAQTLLPSEIKDQTSKWYCSDPTPNGKNGRSVHIWSTAQRNSRPQIQLCSADEAWFTVEHMRPSTSGEYLFLDCVPGCPSQAASIDSLDEFALALVESKCSAWFGKSLTTEQIKSMYRPLLHNRKVSLRVPIANCNVWKVSEARMSYSVDTLSGISPGCVVLPCITVNGIYFKTREMGLSITCTALLVYFQETRMPFHIDSRYSLDETPMRDALPEDDEADEHRTEVASYAGGDDRQSHAIHEIPQM